MNKRLAWLAILTLIFLLNDFVFLAVKSYTGWLAVDYASRIAALAFMFFLIRSGRSSSSDFGFTRLGARKFLLWAAALSVAGVLIDRFGWSFFEGIFPQGALFAFPKADNNVARFVDLTAGMALVSVSEEAIFRGYYASTLRAYIKNPAVIIILSCVMFGLIHWSSGLHAVVTTAIWGILPMICVLKTGSILPALVAHWLTDFIYFFR